MDREIKFTLYILLTFISFCTTKSLAQGIDSIKFAKIEKEVSKIVEHNVDVLSKKVTANLTNDLQKVWAIYCWTAKNIKYDIEKLKNDGGYPNTFSGSSYDWDTHIWQIDSSATYRNIANQVALDRMGICMGYAALFKALCDNNKIRCYFVTGFSKPKGCRSDKADHAWNAVEIDNKWYLVDATWGAGFVDDLDKPTHFEKSFSKKYFLTDPEIFINDHFPSESKWTLLSSPPTFSQFCSTPLRQ